MRAARRVPIVLALTAMLALLAPAVVSARVPQGFAGMVIANPLFPPSDAGLNLSHQFDTMVGSGVESVRAVFNWAYAQPYKDWSEVPADQAADFIDVGGIPTRFDQSDQLVALASQRRLSVLPAVLYAPWWDSAPHPSTSYAQPASDAPYARFVAALVQRYGPHGSFWLTHSPNVPIRMWQIWNEPNITVFWPKQPFQRSYLALLRSSRQAIKQVDPGAKVVFAGMPNYSWQQLAKVYRYRGARKLFDVVAIHPYTRQPTGVIQILSKVRAVMNAHGDRRKPILADEISWPSSLGKTRHTEGFDFATTPTGQARNLTALLPMLARDRARLGLLGFYYYTWAGVEVRNALAFDFAGLFRLRSDRFTAKPAFYAFRRAALAMEKCRRKGAVATVCLRRG